MPIVRVMNPRRKSKSSTRRRRKQRRANTGGGELILMSNPKRKRRCNRRKSNPAVAKVGGRRRRNYGARHHIRRRGRNPFAIAGLSGGNLLKVGIGAAAGAVGTRGITQAILQDKNTGAMGYGANLLAALGLAYATDRFAGRDYAIGVAGGGFAALILRIWSEQVSQSMPAALSGLGDVDFSSNGLGEYVPANFALPTMPVRQASGYLLNPGAPAAAAVVAAAARPGASVFASPF